MFRKNKSRKGQVLIVGIVIAVTISLTTAFILLHYMFKDTSAGSLGSYQAGMIDALSDGDKALIYNDEAATIAANKALKDFTENGGIAPDTSEDAGYENGPGIPGNGNAQAPGIHGCGLFVYNLWDSKYKDCYPGRDNFDYYMDDNIALLTYGNPALEPSRYFDRIVKSNIAYTYRYTSGIGAGIGSTAIKGFASNNYDISIFKDTAIKNDASVASYVSSKSRYSGKFIWPLPSDDNSVSSCFGYRGISTGTKYHGGIDIPAPLGTPVMAAAPGIVSDVRQDWGRVEIDHGGGLKTEYLHLDKISNRIQKGASVAQGDIIGEVGGRGPLGANQYPNHLHFGVIDDNIDPKLKYDNAYPAVVDGTWGKYVNPLCFIDQDYLAKDKITLAFSQSSKACTDTCSGDGSKCALYPNVDSQAYKFCNLYNIAGSSLSCQTSENTDWKITNLQASSKNLKSDQSVNIIVTIENNGESCVHVTPKITITTDNPQVIKERAIEGNPSNIYKYTEQAKFTNINALECTFSQDQQIVQDAVKSGKCILWVPQTGAITYKIAVSATDDKKHDAPSNDLSQEFSVSKSSSAGSDSADAQSPSSSIIQLTSLEKKKIAQAKERLENLQLLSYIDEQSQKNGVPKEIVLGLITQESGGNINAVSPTGAQGLFQVIKSYHIDRINKECGSWESFKTDAECQVRVGVGILKQYNTQYNKGLAFKCSCAGNKGTNSCQDIDTTYQGWYAALRAYNSAGCAEWADYKFVDSVMRYANGWGYSTADTTTYTDIAREDISKGIFGTYSIRPSFSTNINFDLSLMDKLEEFSKNTIKECGASALGDTKACVKSHIKTFNEIDLKAYNTVAAQIGIGEECDTDDEKAMNKFAEEFEDCVASKDIDCDCIITSSNTIFNIDSSSDGTAFMYTDSSKKKHSIYSQSPIYDGADFWKADKVDVSKIGIYKGVHLTFGKSTTGKSCTPAGNMYRLCLKTNQIYPSYITQGIIGSQKIQLNFAITIRDQTPPVPVTKLTASEMSHSNKNIILTWNKNPEKDVVKYIVYLGDAESGFTASTGSLKNLLPYHELSSIDENTDIYDSIDYNNPVCELVSDAANNKYYCDFKYHAAKEKNAIDINLLPNKLYYMSGNSEFLYIIDSADQKNKIDKTSESEKFIAVTAVDLDGNEIDNTADDQKITLGGNMVNIMPKDLLEAGFARISGAGTFDFTTNNLQLSWNDVKYYLDGTDMERGVTVKYKVLAGSIKCKDTDILDKAMFSNILGPYDTSSNVNIDVTSVTGGRYCMGILPISDNNIESDGVLGTEMEIPEHAPSITP